MRMKTILVIAASLVLVVVLGFTFKSPSPTVWEYKFSDRMSESRANELGSQGWEIVTVDSKPMMGGGAIGTYVFKRPKQ